MSCSTVTINIIIINSTIIIPIVVVCTPIFVRFCFQFEASTEVEDVSFCTGNLVDASVLNTWILALDIPVSAIALQLDPDELTVENCIGKAFDKSLRVQLDPVWHQLVGARVTT